MSGFPPPGFRLELLAKGHARRAFASGDVRVDQWLTHKALGAMEKNTRTTRVLVHEDGAVAGYYTLANTALDASQVPAALFGGQAPRWAPPTLTLAWLGVDQRFSGRGLGTKLFARALADGVQVYARVRFVAVIVDALSEANAAFDARHGFEPVPGAFGKLYLPAKTLLEITGLDERA